MRRQLAASIVCAREWSRYLLDDDASPERVRAVLRINERVFRKCMRDIHFRAAHRALGIDPFEALLVNHLALPVRFRETRYPQMRRQLGGPATASSLSDAISLLGLLAVVA